MTMITEEFDPRSFDFFLAEAPHVGGYIHRDWQPKPEPPVTVNEPSTALLLAGSMALVALIKMVPRGTRRRSK